MNAPTDIADRLERCFRDIREHRMDGIPILNPALQVEAVDVKEWGGYWLCILITPWFMNVILLPRDGEPTDTHRDPIPIGNARSFAFPAGRFEFIRGDEPAIGAYWMCSLFSPVLEFADQDTAVATADAALQAMLGEPGDDNPSARDMAMVWRGELPEDQAAAEPLQDQDRGHDADDPQSGDPHESAARPVSRRAFLRGNRAEGTT